MKKDNVYLKIRNSCLQMKNKLVENESNIKCVIYLSTVFTNSHNFAYCTRRWIQNSWDRCYEMETFFNECFSNGTNTYSSFCSFQIIIEQFELKSQSDSDRHDKYVKIIPYKIYNNAQRFYKNRFKNMNVIGIRIQIWNITIDMLQNWIFSLFTR